MKVLAIFVLLSVIVMVLSSAPTSPSSMCCNDVNRKLDHLLKLISADKVPKALSKNCAEIYNAGNQTSGVYTIDPDGQGPFEVFCDQTTAKGGWTVFQKRLDGSVDFYRSWADYKHGFGNRNVEFWLGLDRINRLTKQVKSKLRVDLEDTSGNKAYAEYDFFAVSSEGSKYQLSLGTCSAGKAGDSLSLYRGMAFSTKDKDNDMNKSEKCAVKYKGAWWYKSCHDSHDSHGSNLNGWYHHGWSKDYGVNWNTWKKPKYSVKRAEMKIRPIGFW